MYAYSSNAIRFAARFIDGTGKLFFRERKRKIAASKRILIIKIDHLGDCFLMTPFFSRLHKKFPQAQIDIICMESSIPVFENNPYIGEIILYNKRRAIRPPYQRASHYDLLKLIARLRKNKYDLFIDPRGDVISAAIGFFLGIPDRIGFEKEEVGGFMYTSRLRYDRSLHETAKYITLLRALEITSKGWQPELYPSEGEKKFIDEKLKGIQKPFAVIHPGAGLAYKTWPVERWAPAAEFLLKKNYQVIFAGSSAETGIVNNIISLLPDNNNTNNYAGLFSLRGMHYLISQSVLFIGNDSVLGHFAGAFDIPTVILMNSAVDEKRWRPIGTRTRVITGSAPEHSCLYDECPYPCPNMENISIGDVLNELQSVLLKTQKAAG